MAKKITSSGKKKVVKAQPAAKKAAPKVASRSVAKKSDKPVAKVATGKPKLASKANSKGKPAKSTAPAKSSRRPAKPAAVRAKKIVRKSSGKLRAAQKLNPKPQRVEAMVEVPVQVVTMTETVVGFIEEPQRSTELNGDGQTPRMDDEPEITVVVEENDTDISE